MKKVTFKFQPKDLVLFILDGKIQEAEVRSVRYQQDEGEGAIKYLIHFDDRQLFKNEEVCFKTKQELIDSL